MAEVPMSLVSCWDAVLYRSDIKLLENETAWLNDNCILFWQQWLQHRNDSAHEKLDDFAVFLPPAAAFAMQVLSVEDLVVDTHDNVYKKLRDKLLVLVPIVLNATAADGGGTHWSLLACHPQEEPTMYLFDSSESPRIHPAVTTTAEKLGASMGWTGTPVVVPCPSSQQWNGYDCGVHMCANAEAILSAFEQLHSESARKGFNVSRVELPMNVSKQRKRMLRVAMGFIHQKNLCM